MPKPSKKTYRQQRAEKKAKKQAKALKLQNEENEYNKLPKSFVLRRGRIGKSSKTLVQDTRFLMLPLTAYNLEERPSNTMNDLKFAAMEMCVTHMLIFSRPASGLHMRIGKLPRGPTCLFKVEGYSLRKDIQKMTGIIYPPNCPEMSTPPLLILNGFNKGGEELKTLRLVLQQLFPPVQASVTQVNKFRRCVLFNYNEEDNTVDMRHYVVKVRDSRKEDIHEEILKDDMMIDDDNNMNVNGEQNVLLPITSNGKENVEKRKSYVKLIDIGPRMRLRLLSIYSDFMKGKVLYRLYDYDDDEKWMNMHKEEVKQADIERKENIEKMKMEKSKKMKERKMQEEEDDEEEDDDFYFDDDLNMDGDDDE